MSGTGRTFMKALGIGTASFALPSYSDGRQDSPQNPRPNVILILTDDHRFDAMGFMGHPFLETPHMDRMAKEGILFRNAFCAAPSCAPSRTTILTGQDMWRLQEGGLLFGALPRKHEVFPRLLEQHGYAIGYTGKGHFRYKEEAPKGMPGTDYASSFRAFLQNKGSRAPFFFWVGFHESHRIYDQGIGARNGLDIDRVRVPSFLPDVPEVRSDLLDYYYEIEWTDRHLGQIMATLEEAGELENTIVVVTSDNGMPFPRAKATLYEYGTHMPLVIRWARGVKSGRVVDDLVSLSDLASTFLEAARIPVPPEMTGQSLMRILASHKSGQIDPERDQVITAFERHTWARPGGKTCPMRAIRTHK